MFNTALVKALQIYALTIVIAMFVAVMIKAMLVSMQRLERRSLDAPDILMGTVCPVDLGIPEEDVAALTAAICAMIGPHRILHIGETRPAWTSQGRAAQHTSHSDHPRPKY
jgi:Na+/citrate or Na+/malate symporter